MKPAIRSVMPEAEIQDVLQEHPEWKLQGGKLVREWTFSDFAAAMKFVNRTATLAEAADHHPDIDIRYNRVLLALVSHDVGGITKRDTALMTEIDHLP